MPALGGTFRLGDALKRLKKMYRFLQSIQPMHSWSAVYCNWFFMHPFLDSHLITFPCPSSMQLLPSLMIQHLQHRSTADVFHTLQVPLDNKQHGVQLSYVCSSWLNTHSPIKWGGNTFSIIWWPSHAMWKNFKCWELYSQEGHVEYIIWYLHLPLTLTVLSMGY